MGAIYTHAEKVIIWLGKVTSEILDLMGAIERFRRISTDDTGKEVVADNYLKKL